VSPRNKFKKKIKINQLDVIKNIDLLKLRITLLTYAPSSLGKSMREMLSYPNRKPRAGCLLGVYMRMWLFIKFASASCFYITYLHGYCGY
jgi:hypothetical protein